jgi:hypothetical protein
MDPFTLLTRASEFPTEVTWRYEGPCRIQYGEISWERQIKAAWNASGSGMVEDGGREIWEVGMRAEYGVRNPTSMTVEGQHVRMHRRQLGACGRFGNEVVHRLTGERLASF